MARLICSIFTRSGARSGLGETRARDPFDRIIVAQAKANGAVPLLTSDEAILTNHPNARW